MYYMTHSIHFYLTTHSTHAIYGYVTSNIWQKTTRERNPLLPLHGLLLAARVLLYAPSHTQDSTYRGLCYTSRDTLAPMNRSLMGIEQFIILELIVKISGILPNSPYVVKG